MFEGSGRFFDRDMEPKRFELLNVSAHGPVRMAPIEIIRPEFVVGHSVAHDEERNLWLPGCS
jgi:hypothetical protein